MPHTCDLWAQCQEDRDGSSESDDSLLKEFNETIKYVDGRYSVQIPWRECKDQLRDNIREAEKRLVSQERRLQQNPPLPLPPGCL